MDISLNYKHLKPFAAKLSGGTKKLMDKTKNGQNVTRLAVVKL